jgi:hypothetical protein
MSQKYITNSEKIANVSFRPVTGGFVPGEGVVEKV